MIKKPYEKIGTVMALLAMEPIRRVLYKDQYGHFMKHTGWLVNVEEHEGIWYEIDTPENTHIGRSEYKI